MVARGEVDASAIDSQVLAIALRDDPSLSRSIKIIDSLGPSTIQPIAVSKRVPDKMRERIRSTITNLHQDQNARDILAKGFVKKFVRVGPLSYDDIRHMLKVCMDADFMVIK